MLFSAYSSQNQEVARDVYHWPKKATTYQSLADRIPAPTGYQRIPLDSGSFGHWLRHLPLMPKGTDVHLWDGTRKYTQDAHTAVVDLDFIGKDLQQCVDAIIRLRAEHLWWKAADGEVAFSYTCCNEPVSWNKWQNGWRIKVYKQGAKWTYDSQHTAAVDSSYAQFRKYLFNIMLYAGTQSLSRDMRRIEVAAVQPGDAFVQGGAPGYGHGVLVLDMAENAKGDKIVLLGQSYTPAEQFNVLKAEGTYSSWFKLDFSTTLQTPQWTFSTEHARRF